MKKFHPLYRHYKYRAKIRGIEFNISQTLFAELVERVCHYCGKPPSSYSYEKKKLVFYNGLDRIDNTKGYVEGNIVTCCKYCNAFKSNHTEETFLEHVKRIAKFQGA